MFDFVNMMGNYDDRKIDRYEKDEIIISTAMVTDSDWNYETAVSHLSYNNGNWIIVEGYDTKEDAENGHSKWVETITKNLPETLKDISTAGVVKLGLAIDPSLENGREHKRSDQ